MTIQAHTAATVDPLRIALQKGSGVEACVDCHTNRNGILNGIAVSAEDSRPQRLPLHEAELAEQHFLEQGLSQRAVGFL
jgi:hypothetical protein